MGGSTFIFRVVRSDLYFLSHFSMKFSCVNRIAPDGTPRSAASHLGLYCLPMSHKRTPGSNELIMINLKDDVALQLKCGLLCFQAKLLRN